MPKTPLICELLADRHHGLTEGVRGLPATAFATVVMVVDETSLIEGAGWLQPDVAVVDLSLAQDSGLGWLRSLRQSKRLSTRPMCSLRAPSSPAAENSIGALAQRNCSICSIVRSRVSFMLITIRVMINPLFNSTPESSLQAHSSLEMRRLFRLIPRLTRLLVTEGVPSQ